MIEGFEKACDKALEILPGTFQFAVQFCIIKVILMNFVDKFPRFNMLYNKEYSGYK